jgi:hypothetical protein
MLLHEDELKKRIESPMNLLNRLKNVTNPHKPTMIPSLPPSAEEVINDLEDKITIGSIKGKALGLMSEALDELKTRLPEVQKPERLAAIAADMNKVVSGMQDRGATVNQTAQIIIYAPQVVLEDTFDVVELAD